VSLQRQGSTDSMRSVDTPTRLRNMYGVNSPKVKSQNKGGQFAAASANDPNVPTHLITQVARPGQQPVAGQQPNAPTATTTNEHHDNLQEAQEKSGCCSWLCLPFCGGGPKTQRPQTELVAANQNANARQVGLADDQGGRQPAEDVANGAYAGVPDEEEPSSEAAYDGPPGLLAKKTAKNKGKKCLVLDLDETLVHSSFKPVPNADFIVPVEIDGVVYKVYVLKRPYVDLFLTEAAKYYEMVIFTASLSKYANPLLDMLDTSNVIEHRLFRESCVLHGQAYVKDLSKLGRRMEDIIFVDNSPLSYAFQPTNAVPCLSWFDDPNDTQLRDLLPCLRTTLRDVADVRSVLDANNKSYEWLCAQHSEGQQRAGGAHKAGGGGGYDQGGGYEQGY